MSMTEQQRRDLFQQHQLEQFASASLNIAALVSGYYLALIEHGMDEAAAAQTAIAFQGELFKSARQQEG